MTFEATDTRAPAAAAEETSAPVRPRRAVLARETNLDKMLLFVTKTEMVATNLRGLAALFSGVFVQGEINLTDEQSGAVDIVEDCLRSIAKRLDDNAEMARQTHEHLTRGGAR